VRNPWDTDRTTGGSSSGSAALVASGDADLAMGGDQGGSVRIPSSWCGTVGHKPTHGLVPYTGAFPIEFTIDHLGPITRTVADAALMLNVIAGRDGWDPRQPADLRPEDYVSALNQDVTGLRAGVVSEGFGISDLSEERVKRVGLGGRYSVEKYQARHYAMARNLVFEVRRHYDEALSRFDVLVMPTLPMAATLIPAASDPREVYIARALEMIPNTAPFDISGHPAISVPAPLADGLPVGMMIVGKRF